jgi:predicted tellurium resistance membrane protein TerC
MHPRGTQVTLTDTLHIVFTAVTVSLVMLAIGFGLGALGRRFRRYSMVTLVVVAFFGALTGLEAPRVAAGLPTPWIGGWERANAGAYVLWVIVLAVALLRAEGRRRFSLGLMKPGPQQSEHRLVEESAEASTVATVG